MTDGTKGGAQRASSLRPRCIGEVDPETATHIYLTRHTFEHTLQELWTYKCTTHTTLVETLKRIIFSNNPNTTISG
jgi:hypothetical protein